jgi:hypothetical protein
LSKKESGDAIAMWMRADERAEESECSKGSERYRQPTTTSGDLVGHR